MSVIIPVYNREKTLARCLNSVLASDYEFFELIIVDDGSTDSSWDIINSYKDKRIRTFHKSNEGVSNARNTGIDAAMGDYIHFIDSDDFIEPDLYSKCADVIKRSSPDVVMFDHGVYFEKDGKKYEGESIALEKNILLDREYIVKNILPVMVNIDSRKELFIHNFVWNKLWKRSVINSHKVRFDESRNRWEDRLFQVAFLKWAETFFYIPQNEYYYVLGNSVFSGKYDSQVFDIVLRGKEDYKTLLDGICVFDTDYENNYYSRVFIETILAQFGIHAIDEGIFQKDLQRAIITERAQCLFASFEAATDFERKVKAHILRRDARGVYLLCKCEYAKRKNEQAMEERNGKSILRRTVKKVKRILSK
ncbi:MAG: glycosyltransferase family 2 protein [Eubacteriales bacterium]|nr:glycosyltransferase family 2 protein [Eubacteriales bacterium]